MKSGTIYWPGKAKEKKKKKRKRWAGSCSRILDVAQESQIKLFTTQ